MRIGRYLLVYVALVSLAGGQERHWIFVDEKSEDLGDQSICTFPRADGVDDLIMVERQPIKGLTRLINSRDGDEPWKKEVLSNAPQTDSSRRVATGKIDDDALVDLAELRLGRDRDSPVSLHWYQCKVSAGCHVLDFRGEIAIQDPPAYRMVDFRMADLDGDGDADAIGRFAAGSKNIIAGIYAKRMPPQIIWWRNDGVDKPWPKQVARGLKAAAAHSNNMNFDDDDGIPATDFRIEDLDRDGDMDFAILALSERVTRLWFENDGKGTFKPSEKKPTSALGPMMPGGRWAGRVVTWANVDGDNKPDPIIAYPSFEGDDDETPEEERGLGWKRGGKVPAGVKGGFVILPLLLWRRRKP